MVLFLPRYYDFYIDKIRIDFIQINIISNTFSFRSIGWPRMISTHSRSIRSNSLRITSIITITICIATVLYRWKNKNIFPSLFFFRKIFLPFWFLFRHTQKKIIHITLNMSRSMQKNTNIDKHAQSTQFVHYSLSLTHVGQDVYEWIIHLYAYVCMSFYFSFLSFFNVLFLPITFFFFFHILNLLSRDRRA